MIRFVSLSFKKRVLFDWNNFPSDLFDSSSKEQRLGLVLDWQTCCRHFEHGYCVNVAGRFFLNGTRWKSIRERWHSRLCYCNNQVHQPLRRNHRPSWATRMSKQRKRRSSSRKRPQIRSTPSLLVLRRKRTTKNAIEKLELNGIYECWSIPVIFLVFGYSPQRVTWFLSGVHPNWIKMVMWSKINTRHYHRGNSIWNDHSEDSSIIGKRSKIPPVINYCLSHCQHRTNHSIRWSLKCLAFCYIQNGIIIPVGDTRNVPV